MKIHHWLFWGGLLLYGVTFALPAVSAPDTSPIPGWGCAFYVTIMQPWTRDNVALLHTEPLTYIPTVMTGWINPLFLVTTILSLFRRASALVSVLSIIILLLVPLCWVVFHFENVRPRAGHFLWILGMLLVLLSARLRRRDKMQGTSDIRSPARG